MIRKTTLILAGAMLLAGIAGCTSDPDNSSDDKKRNMTTQQPAPLPPPPSGRTAK